MSKRPREESDSEAESASEISTVELREDAKMVLKIYDRQSGEGVNVALSMDLALHDAIVAARMAEALKLNPDVYEFPARLECMVSCATVKGMKGDAYVEEGIPLELNGHDLLNPLNKRIRNMLFSDSHWIEVQFAKKK